MSVMSPAPETLFLESVGGEQESFEEIKNGKVLVLLATVVSLPSLPVKDTRGTLAACDYYFYIILKYPAYYRVLWEKYHLPLKDSSCKS